MTAQKLVLLAAVTAVFPAFAQAQTVADANGDGVLTLEELQAVFPEVGADSFADMDANSDGMLDQDEIAAAQEAGKIPPSNG